MSNKGLTILHVEDDPGLAFIVQRAFEDLGFMGSMLTAESIREAFDLLNERERKQEHLSLIISDMRLPDGSGLDLIREVKTNPYWQVTPVIVLSGERDPEVVDAAYALGANSYLPKYPDGTNLVATLDSFYNCWLRNIQLPRAIGRDRIGEALDRAVGLRSRTSQFFLDLARVSSEESEIRFWLDRALVEGNLSNLLAFFRDKLSEEDFPPGTVDRVIDAQIKVSNALITAEGHLKRTPSPNLGLLSRWVLELMDAFDEKMFAEAVACLFQENPVVAAALKARAATHLRALALHILDHAPKGKLHQKAVSLLDKSRLIEESIS